MSTVHIFQIQYICHVTWKLCFNISYPTVQSALYLSNSDFMKLDYNIVSIFSSKETVYHILPF